MPLDSKSVDRIFARMAVRYGRAWLDKWAGMPIEAVKADWADQLAGGRYEAIAHGLDHLPDFPPNVTQFLAVCRRAPEKTPLALDRAAADPARVAAVMARPRPARRSPTAWFRELEARVRAGEKLGPYQLEKMRLFREERDHQAIRRVTPAGDDAERPASGDTDAAAPCETPRP